jgi:dihydrofolate synthase/folylpolyglutamate synthase
MNYNETLEYLFNSLPMFTRIGASAYKEGLENTLALDRRFGYPHRKFKTIHVAGTNGKGSVSHLLAAALQEAGYKTGLYTSPHVKDFGERIRINGKMISQDFVVDFVAENRAFFNELKPSFFEMSVIMAFDYFAKNNVEVAVIEVGLGGRLDSTNIITPELSIITNISLDHTNLLGNTLEKIAVEKAGIIKPNVPVVIGEASGGIKQVFEQKAKEENATIYFAEEQYTCHCGLDPQSPNKQEIFLRRLRVKPAMTGFFCSDVNVGLLGNYQKKNIATVLTAIDVLKEKGFKISEKAIKTGFEKVVQLTGLQGRWQIVQEKPLVIMDIGHNEAGISYVVEQLSQMRYRKLHFVVGMVSDKDVDKILSLLPKDAVYYFTKADIPRALNENELKAKAERFDLQGNAYSSVKIAYKTALSNAKKDDVVFVGGSNFVVAEALGN